MSKKKVQTRLAIKGEISIDVPTDTIFSILTRLPVKSLLRFKSVSKPWNAIISDDKFTKIHHHQTKALGRNKLLVQRPSGYFNFRDLENPQLILMEKQLFPLKRLQQCAEIMCSCDGLVLVKDHKSYNEYVLWNPSTTKYRILELCPYLNLDNECPIACGLCYDSNLDDYKVIVICKFFYGVKDIFVLTSLKGCLSLYGGTYYNEGLDIWIMEQDGWKLLMKIYNLPKICILFVRIMKLLWCSENGEIFFHGQSMNQPVIYYPKQKQFVTVSLPDMSRDS
ncbi:PREDICTED: F-box protein CPR30-like [Nicotiana attenuata]|uniref:F-box domain-containing protein n=1 Tax=Nicotiana attenuata TaxID=49451 RepID=A0A1J6KYM8_NICAT|nr:PREDICTED: F-box protein CPR30-like [Nicotiana attenuata]OIT27763.1 hypothetical protein A4A49_51493 [Nicotiana attenuata]